MEFFHDIEQQLNKYSKNDIKGKLDYLINENYHLLTLKNDLTPKDYFFFISKLSTICHNTALCFAMHLYTLWGLNLIKNKYKLAVKYINAVKEEGYLLASLNEPGIYFVSPYTFKENDFNIIAKAVDGGYILTGVKPFVSMEPSVNYLPVYCRIEKYNGKDLGIFVAIVSKNDLGIQVINNWDSIAMEYTQSNSIVLDNVFVSNNDIVILPKNSAEETDLFGYLFRLSICGVYYGMAEGALAYVREQATNQKIPHMNKPLSFLPGAQYSVAQMIIFLETSYSQIIHYCDVLKKFFESPTDYNTKKEIKKISLVTKEYTTKSAKEIVDIGLKVVGIKSLSKSNYLSELYKDVVAGLYHPPQHDVLYELVAKDFFGIITLKNRW
ncbi:acyl-CoA dehydrogenase family protein [Oceanobacillus sp. FSL W7-1309]|uniref:acyl-CoA dehydrogenase family protein n=1 Tax=Oceanobacillus sp. FSL W7-1309 TaxID=2954539 RepID=UPI0030FB9DEB